MHSVHIIACRKLERGTGSAEVLPTFRLAHRLCQSDSENVAA